MSLSDLVTAQRMSRSHRDRVDPGLRYGGHPSRGWGISDTPGRTSRLALSFMDSSRLRSMLIARAAADEAGVRFRIAQASPAVRRLVERTGLQNRLLDE